MNQKKQSKKEELGRSPEKWMKWIVRFIQEDLDCMSEEQWLKYAAECQALEYASPTLAATSGNPHIGAQQSVSWFLESEAGRQISDLTQEKTQKEISSIQNFLKEKVLALIDRRRTEIDLPAATLEIKAITPAKDHMKEYRKMLPYITKEAARQLLSKVGKHRLCRSSVLMKADSLDHWKYLLGFLLSSFGHAVRRCDECQYLFYAKRKDQFICGRKCTNLRGQRVWREKEKQGKAKAIRASRTPTPTRKGKKSYGS